MVVCKKFVLSRLQKPYQFIEGDGNALYGINQTDDLVRCDGNAFRVEEGASGFMKMLADPGLHNGGKDIAAVTVLYEKTG